MESQANGTAITWKYLFSDLAGTVRPVAIVRAAPIRAHAPIDTIAAKQSAKCGARGAAQRQTYPLSGERERCFANGGRAARRCSCLAGGH